MNEISLEEFLSKNDMTVKEYLHLFALMSDEELEEFDVNKILDYMRTKRDKARSDG